MKKIVEYLVEFFLHIKYGDVYFCKNFSLKIPYFYIENSNTTKQFVFVINNEFRYINDSNLLQFRIVILGFGFDFAKNKWIKK